MDEDEIGPVNQPGPGTEILHLHSSKLWAKIWIQDGDQFGCVDRSVGSPFFVHTTTEQLALEITMGICVWVRYVYKGELNLELDTGRTPVLSCGLCCEASTGRNG